MIVDFHQSYQVTSSKKKLKKFGLTGKINAGATTAIQTILSSQSEEDFRIFVVLCADCFLFTVLIQF